MIFDTRKYPPHTGICPMCGKPTRAYVHQTCGAALEAQHKTRRDARGPRIKRRRA